MEIRLAGSVSATLGVTVTSVAIPVTLVTALIAGLEITMTSVRQSGSATISKRL